MKLFAAMVQCISGALIQQERLPLIFSGLMTTLCKHWDSPLYILGTRPYLSKRTRQASIHWRLWIREQKGKHITNLLQNQHGYNIRPIAKQDVT